MLTRPIQAAKEKADLDVGTIRDFTGGWNVLDDDLNLSTKYATKMYNCYVDADGTVTVRQGTRQFADLNNQLSSAGARIVNATYYAAAIVTVHSNGDILATQANGSVARIWDTVFANALPGSPAGWSATDFASFAQFNGELIVCNGVDKPLIIMSDLTVDYLQDLATLTNINTPVCKYVTVCSRYLVMAGDPLFPNRIHISAKDASGTFFGDTAPNDGTFIDVGSILNDSTYIRGIATFRGKLIIGFAEGTIVYELGQYDTSTPAAHVPVLSDPVEQYGAISHRSMVSYGDDMLMLDLVGVPSIKRTVFTGTLKPERVSELVDSEMAAMLTALSFSSLEDRTFAVYNQKIGQFMFFIPDDDSYGGTTETTVFAYTYRPTLGRSGWARFNNWNFTCGCRTTQGEVLFGDENSILWLLGDENNPLYTDYADDMGLNGSAINFTWELPWADLNVRRRSKTCKYISFDTKGSADFTASMFIDRYLVDDSNVAAPALTMDFVGGDAGEYGEVSDVYGGGRNTADERLYAWPTKFNIMKMLITGAASYPLSFTSISLFYKKGSIFR